MKTRSQKSRACRRVVAVRVVHLRWLVVTAALLFAGAPADAVENLKIFTVKERFETVRDEVVDAIIKRGLVIDYTSHIGAMLARTAKDVGASRTVYSEAQALQFCSATLSRRTMEADPANIAFCPYVIFVYALPDSPGITYLGYRPIASVGSAQSKAATEAVNALLDVIAREAAGAR